MAEKLNSVETKNDFELADFIGRLVSVSSNKEIASSIPGPPQF